MSRRAADQAIVDGRVRVNEQHAALGQEISATDTVQLDDAPLTPTEEKITVLLNKPVGYVCSRNGQGSKTIYELLPPELHNLKPVGRLDKDSSGVLLLTNDGDLAHELTHPSKQKTKVYEVSLSKSLAPLHQQMITDYGIQLEDGPSQFSISKIDYPAHSAGASEQRAGEGGLPASEATSAPEERRASPQKESKYQITMHEGRNRQIRRTFAALGYEVKSLHRTHFGNHALGSLSSGKLIVVDQQPYV